MVRSVLIICEDGPFGKNSVVESFRMAAGLLAVGDIEDCKVLLLKDAVYFLNKNINPEAIQMDKFENVIRLIELSELQIFIHEKALRIAGLRINNLILQDFVTIVNNQEMSELFLKADISFKY